MAWTSRRRRFNATLLVRLPRRPGRCKGYRREWNIVNFVSFHAHNFSAEFCARNNQTKAPTCLVAVEAGFDKPSNTSPPPRTQLLAARPIPPSPPQPPSCKTPANQGSSARPSLLHPGCHCPISRAADLPRLLARHSLSCQRHVRLLGLEMCISLAEPQPANRRSSIDNVPRLPAP